jgi:hypothetical protein
VLPDVLTAAVLVAGVLSGAARADGPPAAGESLVDISTDFPGGNVVVKRNEGAAVELAPDLRGGRDWFYWCFEATAKRPGVVVFTFPEKVAGFEGGAIGNQGPAVSVDGGKSWGWMGTKPVRVKGTSFGYGFSRPGQKVRFAVTIPYLQSDFEAFVARNAKNPHLTTAVLTRSRQGRPVELVQIGRPGPGVKAVLMTARHHACESIASFVLEGLMQAAIADTPAGEEFRRRYVLYAVPFVDKDGVEDGDQGKWRSPHDHNRDYGDKPLYPEVRAIMELGEAKDVRAALDFHCPTLVMPDHQVMYFAGPADVPAHNLDTVKQFAERIKSELPEGSPVGPLVWLRKAGADSPSQYSGHFARRKGILMAATLEVPFAPPRAVMDPQSVRSYGAAILRAWNRMMFAGTDRRAG